MRFLTVLSVVLIYGILPARPAHADDYTKCATEFDSCLKACDDEHGSDTAGRAACTPVCSGKYAACDAGVAYDKAKPWVEEQAGKTKKFFEDLMEKLKKDPPEEPTTPPSDDMPTEKSI